MSQDESVVAVPLPDGAPEALREFVACSTDRVELDMHDRAWLPKPPHVPDALVPTVTIDDDWTPERATVAVHFGPIVIHLRVEIVDGELRVHTGRMPFGIGHEITDGIHAWVDAVNATLAANGKALGGLDVSDNTITITKLDRPG